MLTLAGSTFAGVTIGGVAEDTIRNFENVIGGAGADTLTGDGLANYFFGGLGNDALDGGAGIDTADYSDKITSVSVTLAGATPVTVKVNGVVEDTVSNIENIIGGGGKDTLIGDALANRLEGGTNNDILMGGGGADVMDGGAGIDTADYSDKTVGVSVTLAEAAVVSVLVNGVIEDTIGSIEQVFAGSGNDTLIGDSLANRFESGAGDDFLRGGGGIDFMDGGSGIDTADYSDKGVSVSVTLGGLGPEHRDGRRRGRGHDPQRRERDRRLGQRHAERQHGGQPAGRQHRQRHADGRQRPRYLRVQHRTGTDERRFHSRFCRRRRSDRARRCDLYRVRGAGAGRSSGVPYRQRSARCRRPHRLRLGERKPLL